MDSAATHAEAIASLTSMSEPEASRILIDALSFGCAGGFTLARAEVFQYEELVHRIFGCQNEKKRCDLDECPTAMSCEEYILQDLDYIYDMAPRYTVANMFFWMRLANTVVQYEELIRKRWLKKTQAQRKEFLLSAMPGMAPMHRPDIQDVLHRCCPYDRHPRGIAYHAFTYTNLEDLMKPKSLLMLLDTRGRHLPNEFAYSDF